MLPPDLPSHINSFLANIQANVPFLYPLKTENQSFSDVFGGWGWSIEIGLYLKMDDLFFFSSPFLLKLFTRTSGTDSC